MFGQWIFAYARVPLACFTIAGASVGTTTALKDAVLVPALCAMPATINLPDDVASMVEFASGGCAICVILALIVAITHHGAVVAQPTTEKRNLLVGRVGLVGLVGVTSMVEFAVGVCAIFAMLALIGAINHVGAFVAQPTTVKRFLLVFSRVGIVFSRVGIGIVFGSIVDARVAPTSLFFTTSFLLITV
jgi:hypothetical protein